MIMRGKFTLNDFSIIFNSKGVSLNGEDDNLGSITLEGYKQQRQKYLKI